MKQSKVTDYRPNYPKKLIRGAILTAAAAVALTGTTGCCIIRTGGMPEPVPTDELALDGETVIDPGWEDIDPTPEPEPEAEGSGREEPELMGKIAVFDEPENP